ncbi:MAG TPA: hypothetical protein VG649_08565 [Candidatus Angelobacter sp.]|nr:hypothetical protein [Candidatus Angelobacter sp.]
MSEESKTWEFWGYESQAEGHPVQIWFDGLPIEAKEEIIDLVEHLRVMVDRQWRSPEFDPLVGAGGISELRPADIRCQEGTLTYRIYGWRGYPDEWSYTFLYGARKEVKNDREGKAIAKRRLEDLAAGRATVHRFDFEKQSDSETESGA